MDAARFTAATSEATGKSERNIQRAAARGEALGSDLKQIEGTSLDKSGVRLRRKLRLHEFVELVSLVDHALGDLVLAEGAGVHDQAPNDFLDVADLASEPLRVVKLLAGLDVLQAKPERFADTHRDLAALLGQDREEFARIFFGRLTGGNVILRHLIAFLHNSYTQCRFFYHI
ncbi:hypothetical protein [Rhodoblastus sp.]|uniref:hypothetical protein n=1 Tax=Rhodoblastus sp. TaxID=1962975 RepID=UPI0035B0DED8